ncbi:MAG TPA: hypothetical protein VFP84_14210, partial [Kofleriaceae bacterium]|nr:hypothetical protein [Kofleriaceae bacterium]
SEPLGQGELADLAVLRRKAGQVALRAAVSDALDGAPPRAIRVIGDTAAHSLPLGALRVARAGRADLELEAALVAELGRIAVIEGDVARGVLEARLHGLAALALDPPAARPAPWPAGACLLVAADEDPRAPAWLRALAPFTSA